MVQHKDKSVCVGSYGLVQHQIHIRSCGRAGTVVQHEGKSVCVGSYGLVQHQIHIIRSCDLMRLYSIKQISDHVVWYSIEYILLDHVI